MFAIPTMCLLNDLFHCQCDNKNHPLLIFQLHYAFNIELPACEGQRNYMFHTIHTFKFLRIKLIIYELNSTHN